MHEGHRDRVRARFMKEGLSSFEEHQALELLLFYAIPRRDTNDLAHLLLQKFGSLAGLFNAELADIANVEGIGVRSAALIKLVPELTRKYWLSQSQEDQPKVSSILAAAEYARTLLHGKTSEHFYVVCLDAQYRVKSIDLLSRGTATEAPVYIRHITECVIRCGADKVFVTHNHPGGKPQPSKQDVATTMSILSAMDALCIEFLDHIIIAEQDFFSFAQNILQKRNYSIEDARAAQYSGSVMQYLND